MLTIVNLSWHAMEVSDAAGPSKYTFYTARPFMIDGRRAALAALVLGSLPDR